MTLKTWEECRLLWEARGYKIAAIAAIIADDKRFENRELAESTIQRLSKTADSVDADLAELIWSLPVLGDNAHKSEIVEAGLETLAGQGAMPKVDSKAIAKDVAKEIVDRIPSPDVFARAVADRLPRTDDEGLKKGVTTSVVRGLVPWIVGTAGVLAVGALVLAVILAVVARWSPSRFSDLPFLEDRGSDPDGAHQLGESAERYIPEGPFPKQKVPPCDIGYGESAINGGCWAAMAHVKPPCGRLFRHGNECYRPIAANPNAPVSDDAR